MQKVSSTVINSISASQIQRSGAAFGDILKFDGSTLTWKPTNTAEFTEAVCLSAGFLIAQKSYTAGGNTPGLNLNQWFSLRSMLPNPGGLTNPWLNFYTATPKTIGLLFQAGQITVEVQRPLNIYPLSGIDGAYATRPPNDWLTATSLPTSYIDRIFVAGDNIDTRVEIPAVYNVKLYDGDILMRWSTALGTYRCGMFLLY